MMLKMKKKKKTEDKSFPYTRREQKQTKKNRKSWKKEIKRRFLNVYDRGKPCFFTISEAFLSNVDRLAEYSVAISKEENQIILFHHKTTTNQHLMHVQY